MMSHPRYLLEGWVLMHRIWPGRRAHLVKYDINNSELDGILLASFCQSRAAWNFEYMLGLTKHSITVHSKPNLTYFTRALLSIHITLMQGSTLTHFFYWSDMSLSDQYRYPVFPFFTGPNLKFTGPKKIKKNIKKRPVSRCFLLLPTVNSPPPPPQHTHTHTHTHARQFGSVWR